MNDRKLLQFALEHIESGCHGNIEVIAAIRARLAQKDDEPVAWRTFDGEGNYDLRDYEDNETYQKEYIERNGEKYLGWVEPLYLHPPAKYEPLTNEMTIKQIAEKCWCKGFYLDSLSHEVDERLYTESDVSKMLRYVAMEVAKIAINREICNG